MMKLCSVVLALLVSLLSAQLHKAETLRAMTSADRSEREEGVLSSSSSSSSSSALENDVLLHRELAPPNPYTIALVGGGEYQGQGQHQQPTVPPRSPAPNPYTFVLEGGEEYQGQGQHQQTTASPSPAPQDPISYTVSIGEREPLPSKEPSSTRAPFSYTVSVGERQQLPTLEPSASPLPSDVPSMAPSSVSFGVDTPLLPGGAFQLKLHHQDASAWQNQGRDEAATDWCVACGGGACNHRDRLRLKPCDKYSDEFKFVSAVPGDESSALATQQVYIKHESHNLCWEVTKHVTGGTTNHALKIYLKDCDAGNPNQMWETKGNGEFWQDSFEVYPVTHRCVNSEETSCNDMCVNQKSFPDDDETLWVEDCSIARRYNTSLWELQR